MPEVVTLPAKVLVPLTVRLDVPVLFVMAALLPLITSDPTVTACCKSKVALLIVKALRLLPKVPEPLKTMLPLLMVVAPP